MEKTNDPHAPHPLTDLLRELRDEGTTLFRQEIDLAKIEMSEKADQVTQNAVKMGLGAGVAGAGLFVLLIGISYLVSHLYLALGADPAYAAWLGPVTVGILTGVIGWAMIASAKKKLNKEKLAPERTIRSLHETRDWAQQKLQRTHNPAV